MHDHGAAERACGRHLGTGLLCRLLRRFLGREVRIKGCSFGLGKESANLEVFFRDL